MTHEIVMDRTGRTLVDGELEDRDAAIARFAAESAANGVPILVAVTENRAAPRLFHVDADGVLTPATTHGESGSPFSTLLDPVRERVSHSSASGRAAVTEPCSHCRAVMPAGLQWCGECGRALHAVSARAGATSVGVQRLLTDVLGSTPEPSAPSTSSAAPLQVRDWRTWPSWLIATAAAAIVLLVVVMTLSLATVMNGAQGYGSEHLVSVDAGETRAGGAL